MPTTRSKRRRLSGNSNSQLASFSRKTLPTKDTRDPSAEETPLAYIQRVFAMFEPSSSTLKIAKQPSEIESRLTYIRRALSMFMPGLPSDYPNASPPANDHLLKVRQNVYNMFREYISRVIADDDKLFESFQVLLPQEILELDEIRRQAVQDFGDYDSGNVGAQACAENFKDYISKIDNELRDNSITTNANFAMGVELLMLDGVVQRGMDLSTSELYDLLIAQKLGGIPFAYNIIGETPPGVFNNYAHQVDRIVKAQTRLSGKTGNWPKLQKLLEAKVRAADQLQ